MNRGNGTRGNRGMKCMCCGEPWSVRADDHQPDCDARKLLRTHSKGDRAQAVATFKRSLDEMGRAP